MLFRSRRDGQEVKPLPKRGVKLEDVDDGRDWKWMFRISSNWRTGMLAPLPSLSSLDWIIFRALLYRGAAVSRWRIYALR